MKARWIPGIVAAGALASGAVLKARDSRMVDDIETRLNERQAQDGVFTEEMVSGLPDPARRYFMHAIAPGTPLANRLHWTYTGEMKPGKDLPWMPLSAEQTLIAGRGFVWRARAGWGPLFVTAVDHYLDGESRMRIELFGFFPFVNAGGGDIAKSAKGRLLIEGFAMPSSLLPGEDVSIEGIDENRFTVNIKHRGEQVPLTLSVDNAGRLLTVEMPRWGNITPDGSFRHIPYGGFVTAERTFGGYTIPAEASVGWWFGTPDYLEVIRLTVDQATLD